MINLNDEMCGVNDILFSGQTEFKQVTITSIVQDSYGKILYLTGPDKVLYNWKNIISMRKMRTKG